MASFLARTAGLGGNAPVANAKTAQTANIAQNAGNANTVGGYAPSGLVRVASATTDGFFNTIPTTPTYGAFPGLILTITAPGDGLSSSPARRQQARTWTTPIPTSACATLRPVPPRTPSRPP